MPLVKNNNASKADSKFEEGGDDSAVDNGAVDTNSADARVAAQVARNAEKTAASAAAEPKAEAPTPEPKAEAPTPEPASTSTAVAAKPAANLATSIMSQDPTKDCENALRVDYNTLTQIMVTNGNVALKEGKELMGKYVGLELISFQDQWVCSPGGDSKDEESKEFLKYSDDGKYVKGTDELLTDALARAIEAGYNKARITERTILVGALIYPGEDEKGRVLTDLQDELVQIDLAPRSKNNFKAYRANVAFKVSRNLLTPEAARRIKMSAKVQSKGSNNWTDADFSVLADSDIKSA